MFDLPHVIDSIPEGNDGGRERTKEEYKELSKKPGLYLNRFIGTISPFSIIELIKK